jgi:hypothetical protein
MGAKRKNRAIPAAATWSAKATVATLAMGLLGGVCGAGLSVVVPEGGLLAGGRARHHLATDTAAGLRKAASLQDGDTPDDNGVGALARMLLWLEHGAADDNRAGAERLLKKASSTGRKSPEALYARALLVDAGNRDAALDDDLKAAPESPWVHLARARHIDDVGARLSVVERAALWRNPLPHANHQWAKVAAQAGDFSVARAALDRLFRLAPEHAGGAATAVVVGLVEKTALPAAQRERRPELKQADGPAQPDHVTSAPDERRLLALLDHTRDPLDGAQLALLATALAFGHGAEAPTGALHLITEGAANSVSVARAGLELAVCVGDVVLADAIMKAHHGVADLALVAQISRARYLQSVAEGDRRAAIKGAIGVDGSAITLPLCVLQMTLDQPGLPWRSVASSTFFPERRYQRLLTELAGGGTAEHLDERLQAIEKLGLVDRAIAGADFATAASLLKEAKAKAGVDADVALTEASLKARQGDRAGVKLAVDAAVAGASLDPAVLLAAARLSLDVDNLAGVRKALLAFDRLGLRAAQAYSLTALLEARSGDVGAARVALAEARRLGAGDDVLTLQAAILANRMVDVVDARAAADALLKMEGTSMTNGGDVVAAWIAEAAWRAGDQARAEAALKAITTSEAPIGEANLFYANVLRFNPQRKAEAIAAATTAIKRIERGPLLDEAKKLLLLLKQKQ